MIVDVDERSLSAIGQWPWRRDVIARLVARMRDLGASARLRSTSCSPSPIATTGRASPPTKRWPTPCEPARSLLGYALTFGGASVSSTACVQHPLGIALIRRGDEPADQPFFEATGAVCSLPILTQAAGFSGFSECGARSRWPSQARAIAHRAQRTRASRAGPGCGRRRHRHPGHQPARAQCQRHDIGSRPPRRSARRQEQSAARYRGIKHTFPYISAVDVLSGDTNGRESQGKIVFVGTTALGTREVVATRIDTLFAGVEVQATVADNLLQQDFIRRPESAARSKQTSCSGSASSRRCSSAASGWLGALSPPQPVSPPSGAEPSA